MIVERQNNEILIKFGAGTKATTVQRQEELTSKSTATEDDVDNIIKDVKKGRWNKIKKEIGLND
ncbi:MAG: hypothetical protein WD577_05675 [Bacteroidales bacterium]